MSATVPATGDSVLANNSETEATTVTSGADISLAVSGPATAASGSFVDYTFTSTNNGPDTVSNMTLQFPVPTGIANVTPPPGCTLSGGTYSCSIAGPLAVGESATSIFNGQVTAGSGSTITSVGTIGGGTPADGVSTNNTATFNTTVTAGSDVSISKSRTPASKILTGDPVTFTLSPQYTGDSPTGLAVQDIIPANYAITSVTAPGWTCTTTGQTVDCTRPSGSSAGVNVSLGPITINTTAITAGSATNTATISSTSPKDPVPANNTATDGGTTITDPVIDLQANKSFSTTPPLAVTGLANTYGFTISTSNVGNAPMVGLVQMVDIIPAGATVTAFTLNGWSCGPAAPIVGPAPITCTRTYTSLTPLGVNQTTPPVALTTTFTSSGAVNNSMTVSGPDLTPPEPNLTNNTANFTVTADTGPNAADVGIIKTRSLASLVVGDVQTFTLEITNAGPLTAGAVKVNDNLTNLLNANIGATGAGYINEVVNPNAASGMSCSTSFSSSTSRLLACTIASLPVCTTGVDCPTIDIQVRPGGNAATLSNTAEAFSSATPDPDLSNRFSTVSYDVTPRADVTVTKADSPDPVGAGQNLTYVVTAQNLANGLSSADNVTINDVLPANLTFISATPASGSCGTTPTANSTTGAGNNSVVCNLGTIANGAQSTVTIVVRPNLITRGTTVTNAVTISTTTPEIDSTNNSASAPTTVQSPAVDLLVNKTDSVDPMVIGSDTVYTVTATNNGPSAAENVVVTDVMPASRISYQSHVATGATCSVVPAVDSFGGTLKCTFPVIPAGQSRTITITGRGVTKGVIVNNVSVSSDETTLGFESNIANNSTSQSTTVRTRVDVEVASKVATPATVDLLAPFTYTILVNNKTGTGLAEADNVALSDSLPANMVLTGVPTASVVTGTADTTTCTGAAGAASFGCSFGTVSNGAQLKIVVPVKVTAITSQSQAFTNSATVSTSSADVVAGNNTNSGNVTINGSSIAGMVFRDFNADSAITTGDTGITGVTMTLTGTDVDGNPVNRTTTTDGTGAFTFGLLPQGTYSITQGAFAENYLTDGTTTAGTSGGTSAPKAVNAITLAGNTAATGYLFPEVPQAHIGLAKSVVTGPTVNADGSYTVTFRLTAKNLSLETLKNIDMVDTLAGAAPDFGTQVTLAVPATDAMAEGNYTMLSAPSGTCTGTNAAFNGSASTTVASAFTLATGASCTTDIAIRVRPVWPLPPTQPSGGQYQNQATITGEGLLSGQTSATNPQLQDSSDNGSTVDANGNGQANEAGENDVTPVNVTITRSIGLIKAAGTVVDKNSNGVTDPGDEINYTFKVTNTGNVTLTAVAVTDAKVANITCPSTTLLPGASTSCTGNPYVLTQADIDAGKVVNTANTTGTPPSGPAVTDVSDESANGTGAGKDDPTTTPVTQTPSISVIKTAAPIVDANSSTKIDIGDTIAYSFTIKNTGNVTLSTVTLTDAKVTGLSCLANTLAPGATTTCTGNVYTLVQADFDAGQASNTATASGKTPSGGSVSDLSDESTFGAGAGKDDPTLSPLPQLPAIGLIKSGATPVDANSDSKLDAGDTVAYTFTVKNLGNVTLNPVSVSDTKVTGITCAATTLAPGLTTNCSGALYVLKQADLDAGQVTNQATASGKPPTGAAVTDLSDSTKPADGTNPGSYGAGAGNDDPTVTPLAQAAAIGVVKSAAAPADVNGNSLIDAGDTIAYTILVKNTGNVTLDTVALTDTLKNTAGTTLALTSGPTLNAATDTGSDGKVTPNEQWTYTASYTLTQADVDSGGLTNTVSATAKTPTSATVSDVSDSSNPADGSNPSSYGNGTGNGDDDPTVSPLTAATTLDVIKTANVSALSTPPKAGETITYTITAKNKGNVTLSSVVLSDTLKNAAGTTLALTTGPTFTAATDIGSDAKLSPSEQWTYTASYTLTQADIDSGSVNNSATVDAKTPSNGSVSDTSGPTTGTNSPTVSPLATGGALDVIKTADASGLSTPPKAGDSIAYTITAKNTGNVTLSTVVLTDTLKNAAGTTLALISGPTLTGATDIGADAKLSPDEQWTYTASYSITQADIDSGSINNSATVDAKTPSNGSVSDVSGPTTGTNAPTLTPLSESSILDVIKTADVSGLSTPPKAGESIAYIITAKNNGNVTLNTVVLTDTLKNAAGTTLAMTAGPTLTAATDTGSDAKLSPNEQWTYTASYTLTQADIDSGSVNNSATVSAKTPANASVSDSSGPTTGTDAPTLSSLTQAAAMGVVKSADAPVDVNGNSLVDAGDTVAYTILVKNTGNVTLSTVALADTLKNGTGATLTLTAGPTLTAATDTGSDGKLTPNEQWTYTANYALTQADVDSGSLTNTVSATAKTPTGPSVSDTSDSSNAADGSNPGSFGNGTGNGDDDPTVSPLTQAPAIALTKTATFNDENGDTFAQVNETISYSFSVKNTGNVTLTAVGITDTKVSGVTCAAASLAPGASTACSGSLSLTGAQIKNGSISNQATASGTPPTGAPVTDLSDSTNPADGTNPGSLGAGAGKDDPTVTPIKSQVIVATNDSISDVDGLAGNPNVYNVLTNDTLGTAAATTSTVTLTVDPASSVPSALTFNTATGQVGVKPGTPAGTYTFDYDICETANPLNCTKATATVVVVLSTVSGTVYIDNNGNHTLDGPDVPAGAGYIVELVNSSGTVVGTTVTAPDGTYTLPASPGSGYSVVFKNPAGGTMGTISGITVGIGTTVVDQNQPIDPSGVIYDSVTRLPVAGVTVTLTDNAGNPLPPACLLPGQQGQITNASGAYRFDVVPGAAAACPVGATTYQMHVVNPGGYAPSFSTTIPPQAGAINLNTCPIDAIPGGTCDVSASGAPPPVGSGGVYFTSFIIAAGSPDLTNNHIAIDPVPAGFTKKANVATARRGDTITYTIDAESVPFDPARVTDTLPPGLSYVANSAMVNGVPTAPAAAGAVLTFDNVHRDAAHKIHIVLKAVVSAAVQPGPVINRTQLINPATGAVFGNAKAAVEILPEHVFDCSDIIGKVFEDSNRNGYEDDGEPGLPGVRLATVNGTLITTDAYGRYHVPCAALPDHEIGSNFILKLDTRTLPTGYRVTTENPKTVRVTAGKATKLNFGASIARVIRLDLTDEVFAGSGTAAAPRIEKIVAQLVAILDKAPSILRLTYYEGADGHAAAQTRLAEVQKLIGKSWAKRLGRYQLPVEARIVGAK
jgi:uncharacterized repeat protein (TIGR01451 family)